MGFGIKELIVVLIIVILLFGTKKLKTMGTDLGSAIKGFKKSVADDEEESSKPTDAIDSTSSEADITSVKSPDSEKQPK